MTGRDDALARPSHPTADELADLREGLLSNADEARVQAHVDGCTDCAAATAALDDVAALLREAGAEPVAMPSAVARALDAALGEASSARAAEPTLPARDSVPKGPRRQRSWVKPAFGWLAGAAAAVVIVGGIGAGLNNLGSNTEDSAGGATSLDSGAEAGPPTTPSGSGADGLTGKNEHQPKHIDERSIRGYARALALRPARPASGDSSGGVPQPSAPSGEYDHYRCPTPHAMGGLERPVVWHGAYALLVVRREARVASVYSCDATPRLLYSAVY